MSSYVVWANKGGIGKSTLSFQLACAAAHENPTKEIYVIDLSPQCDVSRMLLGGGHNGGEEIILGLMASTPRKTVQSYLSDCLNNVPTGHGWPDINDYVIKPNDHRAPDAESLPDNVRLLTGDFDLERTIALIEQLPQPPRRAGRAPTGPEFSQYVLVRSFIKHGVEQLENNGDSIIIIDTDPYFNVITTHMGLLAADHWVTAYSPNSQASQFAVMRSLEFMFEPASGLKRFVEDEQARYPNPWYDYRGNPMPVPSLEMAEPFLLIANMTNPYRLSGGQSYTDPQRLHRQTIASITERVEAEADLYNVDRFPHHEHLWDMRRLGLICDYNGVELQSLELGSNYPEPGSNTRYHLNRTGGTPTQLEGYQRRLGEVARLL
ncbi:AAA family ATPase [Pseudomonas protegens]|uniref:ParA family protein n=1 Tax=Pseudomonas protegens TaxID=380021 RepID=UPI003158BDA0